MATSKKKTSTSKSSLSGIAKSKDYLEVPDRNTDDLELRSYEKAVPELDYSGIHFVHAAIAEGTIALAKQMIDSMMAKLGPDQSKPNIPGLGKMFDQAFNIRDKNNQGKHIRRELQSYIPILKEMEQSVSGSMDELLEAKHNFEKGSHKNKTDFMLNSIKIGAEIATSKVNWDFAVNTYREAKENAEANFKDDVHKAYLAEVNQLEPRGANLLSNVIITHQTNTSYAVKVTEAIEKYGAALADANSELSDAFAQLSKDLVAHWNEMAASETELMQSNRLDSLELWQTIKGTYDRLLQR